jgi:hypothetical protein
MIRRTEVTYHGPHHDHAGRITGWPERHAVVVAVAKRPGEDYEPRRIDAIMAASAYCAPNAYDEPDDGRNRRPAYTYTVRTDPTLDHIAVILEPVA